MKSDNRSREFAESVSRLVRSGCICVPASSAAPRAVAIAHQTSTRRNMRVRVVIRLLRRRRLESVGFTVIQTTLLLNINP